ncbi:(Fe-S)-binding protein [Telmatospirillum sp. J64-1]|uniref:(Fe-S)-binding protein n=1 Tax=Telmatospirillum sp. J64-1 TaxID=2502183 RepID=UPI00115E2FA0|nr:(Fe-S)-binding protein [Telmatospirillum sp. J64-1]
MSVKPMRVGFFVTCLVDLFRPTVGFAAIKLLEDAGCVIDVPEGQTCCGQPAYNSGDREDARALALRVMDLFAHHDAVVVPSGSCAGMIRHHYPSLFEDDPNLAGRARRLADKTYELTQFLADVLKIDHLAASLPTVAAYHDSCSSLREMKVREQPRKLLSQVKGLTVKDLAQPEECCGFGGTFCVKYPDISEKMVDAKVADIEATGAEMVLAGDMGCLLNIAGRLKRQGKEIEVRHVAEVLAGMTGDAPGIGEKDD